MTLPHSLIAASRVAMVAGATLTIVIAAGCSSSTEPATAIVVEAVTPLHFSGTVGSAVSPPLAVRITNTWGAPVTGVAVLFTATHGGTIAGSRVRSVVTDANGLATAGDWLLGTTSGPQKVTVQTIYAVSGPHLQFTAHAAPGPIARITRFGGNNQMGVVGSALADPLVARVEDSFGNGIADVSVTFAVTAGDGTITDGELVSDDNGIAWAKWTLGAAGLNQAVASAAGVSSEPFTALAVGAGTDRSTYTLQTVDGQIAALRGWIAFISLLPDDSFYAESVFSCCGTSRTYRGWGKLQFTAADNSVVLSVLEGDWLDWARDPENNLPVHGRMSQDELVLSWFVDGPDYNTVWRYRRTSQ